MKFVTVLEGLVLEGAGFEACGSASGAVNAAREGRCWRGQNVVEG